LAGSDFHRRINRALQGTHNNRAENAIRPFVIGRKNWLFSDTPKGAIASAQIYSLIETAKANGQEPYAWLRHILERLPAAQSVEGYEALLRCCRGTARQLLPLLPENKPVRQDGVYGALT